MLIQGDAVAIPLLDKSVHCCVSSPPYWGLRKYSGDQGRIWGGDPECEHEWEEPEGKQGRRKGDGELASNLNVRKSEATMLAHGEARKVQQKHLIALRFRIVPFASSVTLGTAPSASNPPPNSTSKTSWKSAAKCGGCSGTMGYSG